MTTSELVKIKERINETLSKRNSPNGNVGVYTLLEEYKLPDYKPGDPITAEAGKKTIDLLLKITDQYPQLGNGSESGEPIPEGFNYEEICRICDKLDEYVDNPTRGGFVGVGPDGNYVERAGGIMVSPDDVAVTESNGCRASCTGMCVGSCSGMCNGCSGCSGANMASAASSAKSIFNLSGLI